MKKIFILAAFLLGCFWLAFPASITVSSPGSGQTLKTGDLMTISWTCTGITGDVAITLRNTTGTIVITLKDPWHATSSPIYYLIPGTIMPGDYRIRVKDNNSSVYGESGTFTIDGSVDVLEGSFSIGKISCGVSNKKIHTVNVLVEYNTKKDFVLCKTISGKCSKDLGSMIATYKIKNYTWSNGQAVASETTGCNFTCINSCGTIYYPKGTLPAGTGSFIITIYPNSNNDVSGVCDQHCHGSWGDEYLSCDYYDPELTVTLTLCSSFIDPPNAYQYKMVSASSTGIIGLSKADMQVVGETGCGW